MHNLTPHVHRDHVVANTSFSGIEEESGNILDWMQRMFAQDLGEGHLEHCVAADHGNHVDADWHFYLPSFLPLHTELLFAFDVPPSIPLKPPLIDNPISRISFIHLPLRAPPVCA